MKRCGWCETAPATTRYTAPELAGMYVSVCAPCLEAEREARMARIRKEREETTAEVQRWTHAVRGRLSAQGGAT